MYGFKKQTFIFVKMPNDEFVGCEVLIRKGLYNCGLILNMFYNNFEKAYTLVNKGKLYSIGFKPDCEFVGSYEELQLLLNKNEVTFEEAVKLLKTLPDLKINIDIKSTDNLSAVVEIAKKYDIFPRIFFTGVDSNFVDAVREQTKDVPYYLNVSVKKRKNKKPDYLASLVDTVKKAGAVGINFNRKTASKELVEAFHEAGLLVSIWTVNKKKDMYKIYSYMPDNMTTRNPDILRHEIDIIK